MKPGGARTRVRGFQGVDLLNGAVGLDDGHRHRAEPEVLGTARAAERQVDQLFEKANAGLLLRSPEPAVEDGDEPIAVGGRATTGRPRWWT